MSVGRSESRCPEAELAALMASEGPAVAKAIRADLRDRSVWDLPPEPGETSMAVDDKPSPFATARMADRYLRFGSPPGHHPGPGSWQQRVDYATARAFRAVSEIGNSALPGLAVFGTGDTLSRRERARRIGECVRDRRPFAVIKPIDAMTRFLGVDGDERHASVAIVVHDLQHMAIALACGSTVALSAHHAVQVRRDGDAWVPAGELPDQPVLHGSIAAPISTPGLGGHQAGALIPESGNPMLLNGVLLGAVEAAYQPDCWPCDCAGVYIATAAGRTTVRVIDGRVSHPHEVLARMISALRNGEKVPGHVVARDELAAHRLLNHLRQS
jgi:hypothetical protein